MTDQSTFRLPSFYLTDLSPCPYLDGMQERKMFTHLEGEMADELLNQLSHNGFRRSQNIIYRPACEPCMACRSVRIDVERFAVTTSFRRTMARNSDLIETITPPQASREQYDLLRRYLDHRHENGGMSDMTSLDYINMIEDTSVDTHLVEFRSRDDTLIACMLIDKLRDGLSLVYSFFDPILQKRSLGNYMVLSQIERARRNGIGFIYLGYYVANSPKMSYKKRFMPLQELGSDGWKDLEGDDG
jgi:arginyl-tRNA--protein-N-Asp/Glu arginylyltransferase